MKTFIFPYKMYSKSGKVLAKTVETLRLRHTSRPKRSRVVVNWGSTTIPTWRCKVLNRPECVKKATNKLLTFRYLSEHGVSTPDWTTDKQVAAQWITDGSMVYARSIINGSGGQGIILCTDSSNLPDVPLYTKRVPAKHEYRVHVFADQVIDIQQKRKRNGVEGNKYIKNHSNGYVYARSDLNVPEVIPILGLAAVKALGLDIGAVDIGYVERTNTAVVYEVNTAPGLYGTTLNKYAEAILCL